MNSASKIKKAVENNSASSKPPAETLEEESASQDFEETLDPICRKNYQVRKLKSLFINDVIFFLLMN